MELWKRLSISQWPLQTISTNTMLHSLVSLPDFSGQILFWCNAITMDSPIAFRMFCLLSLPENLPLCGRCGNRLCISTTGIGNRIVKRPGPISSSHLRNLTHNRSQRPRIPETTNHNCNCNLPLPIPSQLLNPENP
jgi:hypothetical protein